MKAMREVDLQAELQRRAELLRPVGKAFVSVLTLAGELGAAVSIRVHTSSGSPAAQIDLRSRPPRIILYRRGKVDGEREVRPWEEDMLTSRERFSVAHELGHLIAFKQLQISPHSDKQSYWEQERAINTFAACLLAPDWLVARWLETTPDGIPVPPFALRDWAISQCRSSEEVVAKALARHRKSIGFLRLRFTTRSSDGAEVLEVLCSAAGSKLKLPNDRSHIHNPHLFGLLKENKVGSASLRQLRLGRCEPQDLQLAWRRATPVKSKETIWVSIAAHTQKRVLPKASPLQSIIEWPVAKQN